MTAGKESTMTPFGRLLSFLGRLGRAVTRVPARLGRVGARALGMHDGTTTRRKLIVIGLLSALLMTSGAVAGTGWLRANDYSATRSAEAAARAAANTAVPRLLSYNSVTLDEDLDRNRSLTTGPFAGDYAKLTDAVIKPAAKARKVTTTASASATSVVSAARDEVVLLMFINQRTTSLDEKMPRLDSTRIKVTMRAVDGHWRIANLEPL